MQIDHLSEDYIRIHGPFVCDVLPGVSHVYLQSVWRMLVDRFKFMPIVAERCLAQAVDGLCEVKIVDWNLFTPNDKDVVPSFSASMPEWRLSSQASSQLRDLSW